VLLGPLPLADTSLRTTQLQVWVERMRVGDAAAREELVQHATGRLQRLTRKMLKGFPGVRRWEQTDDVLQNAFMRLLRALQTVQPASVRDFFGLAAEQIRRELLDLARHYYGPQGAGAHHASHVAGNDSQARPHEPSVHDEEPEERERWCAFHLAVEKLPVEEREVVNLLYYAGCTQAEAAEVLQVTVRTVQRRWQTVLLKLHGILKATDLEA